MQTLCRIAVGIIALPVFIVIAPILGLCFMALMMYEMLCSFFE